MTECFGPWSTIDESLNFVVKQVVLNFICIRRVPDSSDNMWAQASKNVG